MRHVLLFFTVVTAIFAEDENSITNFNAPASGIVGEYVSVISGDFVDSEVDIVVEAPEPLVLSRNYSSSRYYEFRNELGWAFNHLTELKSYRKAHHQSYHKDPVNYAFWTSTGEKIDFVFNQNEQLVFKNLNGSTNCSSGLLSGHTNIKNYSIHLGKKDAWVQAGNGDIHRFGKSHKGNFQFYASCEHYFLEKLEKGSGITLQYEMQNGNNGYVSAQKAFKKVTQFGADNSIQGWIDNYEVYNAHGRLLRFNASNGINITYFYNGHTFQGYPHHCQLLTQIDSSIRPTIKYGYDLSLHFPKINFKTWGDYSCFIQAEYDSQHKVKCLKSPSGAGGENIEIYKFNYSTPNYCHVYDGNNHRRDYKFSNHGRLSKVKYYKKDYVYAQEWYYWGERHTSLEGNLMEKKFINCSAQTIYKKTFEYDDQHNVKMEVLFGNLTGKGTEESYAIFRENERGRFNNLLKVKEEGGLETQYSYHHNSNLNYGTFTLDNGKIIKRTFKHYWNDTKALARVVEDDGLTTNENDLAGVTERKITYYTTRKAMPTGLPEKIEYKYLDLQTGEEKLIARVNRKYNTFGDVLREAHYDSDNHFRYCLKWEYNAHRRCIKHTNELGQKFNKQYDANDRIIFEEGPRTDVHMEYEYDKGDRLTTKKEVHNDGSIFTTVFKYDVMGNKIAETDSFGNTTEFEYDELDRLVKTVLPINLEGQRPTILMEYNELGYPVTVTDPRGYTTLTDYNIRGKPYRIQHPDGTEELFEYNKKGDLIKSVAINGKVTFFNYDVMGRVLSQEEYAADGTFLSKVTNEYSNLHLIRTTNSEGTVTNYQYDALGRLKGETTLDRQKMLTYNAAGLIASLSDGSIVRKFIYDVAGRVIEERGEDLEGNLQLLSRYDYDVSGNKSRIYSYTDGESSLYTEFNSRNLPVCIVDEFGYESRFIYNYNIVNAIGQRVLEKTSIDALGNQTIMLHDITGKVVSTERKNTFNVTTSKQEIGYDLVGNKIKIVDYAISAGEVKQKITHIMTYSSSNQLLSLVEASQEPEQKITTQRYNSLGQRVETIKNDGTSLLTTYNEQGLVKTYTATDNSFFYEYHYNKLHKPIEIIDHVLNQTNKLSYNAWGELTHEVLGNGIELSYDYNAQGKLKSISLPDGSSTYYSYQGDFLKKVARGLLEHNYDQFNLSGQCTEVTLMTGQKVQAIYDKLGRMTSLTGPYLADTNFIFDPVGNLQSHTLQNVPKTFTYDDLYQVTSERLHQYSNDSLNNRLSKDGASYTLNHLNQITQQGNTSYAYDKNGNLIEKATPDSTTTYTYDALDRLTSITQDIITTRFTYDSFNRRLTKNNQKFLYQGLNEIGSYTDDALTELRILGGSKGSETGAAILLEIQGQTYIPLHDHNGNVITLLDSRGNLAASYQYSAFGEEELSSSHPNPWRYASKRVDAETGLSYFGHRYYDPSIGRWITPDPIGFSDGPNLYSYLHNNPLLTSDHYGLADAANNNSSMWDSIKSGWESVCGFVRDTFSRVGSSIREGCGKFRDYADRGVKAVGKYGALTMRHTIPHVPVVKDALQIPFHLLEHGTLSNYTATWNEQHSGWHTEGENEPIIPRAIFNGIGVPFDEFKQRLVSLSQAVNEMVFGFYVADHGLVANLVNCTLNYFRIPTNATNLAQKGLENLARKVGPNGVVLAEGHSRGTMVLNTAGVFMRFQNPELADRIHCIELAPPVIPSMGIFGNIEIHISSRDAVPVSGIIGYLGARLFGLPHVNIHKSNGFPFIDHGYENEIYKSVHQEKFIDYRKGSY